MDNGRLDKAHSEQASLELVEHRLFARRHGLRSQAIRLSARAHSGQIQGH